MLENNKKYLDFFFSELKRKNPLKDFKKIKDLYYSIIELYNNKICNLDKNEIINTINILKEKSKSNFENLSENFCKQFIPIMIKVCDIEFHFKPRHNQIISLLFFLFKEKKQGIIENIDTGEGKSLIITLLSTIKAFTGHKVDILTSSPILAERDAKIWKIFINFLIFLLIFVEKKPI